MMDKHFHFQLLIKYLYIKFPKAKVDTITFEIEVVREYK